jgi:hypothetical protein
METDIIVLFFLLFCNFCIYRGPYVKRTYKGRLSYARMDSAHMMVRPQHWVVIYKPYGTGVPHYRLNDIAQTVCLCSWSKRLFLRVASMQAMLEEEQWSLKGCIIDHRSLALKLQSEEVMRRLVPKPLRLYIDRMAVGSKRARSQKQPASPRRSSRLRQRKNASSPQWRKQSHVQDLYKQHQMKLYITILRRKFLCCSNKLNASWSPCDFLISLSSTG